MGCLSQENKFSDITSLSTAFMNDLGRGVFHATVSMPGISSDGRAIVYLSDWCGNLCGHGWFVLLKKTPDGWSIVAKEMLWIS